MEFPNPDIPIADSVVMFLQDEALLGIVLYVRWRAPIDRAALDFNMILNEHPIVRDRNVCRLYHRAVF